MRMTCPCKRSSLLLQPQALVEKFSTCFKVQNTPKLFEEWFLQVQNLHNQRDRPQHYETASGSVPQPSLQSASSSSSKKRPLPTGAGHDIRVLDGRITCRNPSCFLNAHSRVHISTGERATTPRGYPTPVRYEHFRVLRESSWVAFVLRGPCGLMQVLEKPLSRRMGDLIEIRLRQIVAHSVRFV